MIADIAFAALLLVVIPVQGVVSGRAARASASGLDGRTLIVSGLVSLSVLLMMTLAALYFSGRGVALGAPGWGMGAAVVTAGLALTLGAAWARWNAESESEREKSIHQAPGSRRELVLWAVMSVLAGITEELAYRGLLHGIVAGWTGSWWGAAVVCSAAFAVPHAYQGWVAAAMTGGFALGCHGTVFVTDSLVAAMVIHAVHNLVMGVAMYRLVRRRTQTRAGVLGEHRGGNDQAAENGAGAKRVM